MLSLYTEKPAYILYNMSFVDFLAWRMGGNLPSRIYEDPLIIFYEIFAMRSAIRLARLGVCLAHLLSSISTLAVL